MAYDPEVQKSKSGAVFENPARPGKIVCEVCWKQMHGTKGVGGVRTFDSLKNNFFIDIVIMRKELRGGLGGGRAIYVCDLCLAHTMEFMAGELRKLSKGQATSKDLFYEKR